MALLKFQAVIAAFALSICAATTAFAQPTNAGPRAGKEAAGIEPAAKREGIQLKQGSKPGSERGDDPVFDGIYRKFYDTYRLGPADEISIRIKGQPDYSTEKTKVSPTGTIYHMLLGEVSVGGLTLTQITERLTNDLSEYLRNPQVIVQLVEAVSSKIGVLGDVVRPGIYVMARPMSVLDVISEAGGFTDTGDKSEVEVNRQMADGSRSVLKVNVKKILEGKAKPEDNLRVQAGDTVVVHGNTTKTIGKIVSLAGFGNFISFITLGRR